MSRALLILVVLAFCSVSSAYGSNDAFRILADGSVEISGLRFPDIASFHRSDYFRANNLRCGTRMPSQEARADALAKSVADCTDALTSIQAEYWPASLTYVMPVWFHVIYKADGTGNISDATINAQIQVLNEDYGALADTMGAQGFNTRIQFELVGVSRTQNDAWFDTDDENSYKPVLNKDPSTYVNIYSTSASGYLGYAYFPQGSAGDVLDGIVLNYAAVGGRNNGFGLYDQGRTLVHEMGHYLGLYHTFEGGAVCSNTYGSGDLIVDTSAEDDDDHIYLCEASATCASADPIHNYMNYTPDTCMYRFTSEQANRAVCSLVNYRPSTYRVVSDEPIPPVTPDYPSIPHPHALDPEQLRGVTRGHLQFEFTDLCA